MNSEFQLTEYGRIDANFSCSKLSYLCEDKIGVLTGPFGSQLHNEDYVEIGTPIITVEHLGDNRILHENTPCVSDEDKQRLSKYSLKKGDIVFSRVGSVDRRALVREIEDGWLFSGRCLRVRTDKTKLDPVYLSYFFGLEAFKKYLRSIAVGATMPSINTKILSSIPIYYPNLVQQKKIGNFLSVIDDKIQLNNQINQTLEQMAQALFKSWFVDFEPVKAKMAVLEAGGTVEQANFAAMQVISGKTEAQLEAMQTQQPEQYAELKATAELFPDAMQETELGDVPEGWVVKQLVNIAENYKKQVIPDTIPNTTPYVGLEHIGRKNFTLSEWGIAADIDSQKSEFKSGDFLFGKLRPYFHKVCYSPFSGICSTDILVIRPKKIELTGIVGCLINQEKFIEYANLRSTGTRMPRANWHDMAKYSICLPQYLLIKKLTDIVLPLWKKGADNTHENQTLTKLRDTLLPKLLSGELSVDAIQLEGQ